MTKGHKVWSEVVVVFLILLFTGCVFYISQSAWSLLLLLLLAGVGGTDTFKAKCPKCKYEFEAKYKITED